MSTFQGKIKEINGISVDRFDGENLNSKVFFLSHCHTDHMQGLRYLSFHEKLARENGFLYLSNISAIILRALIPGLASHIKELPLYQATSIAIGNKDISVTCIPAGHCPGSVMFLFETEEVCVLYTGDYRVSISDITKFGCFYNNFNRVKLIHKIYLDTTFFLDSYEVLPKRKDSINELCKLILEWVSADPENCIKLDLRAKYGYEYVFKEIYEICKMPVHVDIDKYNFYSVIPELDNCVTTQGDSTKIHNCQQINSAVCEFCKIEKLRIIKLSAFRWRNDDLRYKGISEVDENGVYYVCYSTHASYEEGVALIDFLKPKAIHICVERPNDLIETLTIKKLVKEHMARINKEKKDVEPLKLFEVNDISFEPNYLESGSCEALELLPSQTFGPDNILDSPPR